MRRMQNREKLPRPESCPQEIYEMMLECWKLDSGRRTVASATTKAIELFIQDPVNEAVHAEQLEWPVIERSSLESGRTLPLCLTDPALVLGFASLEISREHIVLDRELGRGQYGSVSLAALITDSQSLGVAVKSLHGSGAPAAEVKQFEYEARLLAALQHRNIVRVIAVVFQSFPQMLVLELMGSDLRGYLKENAVRLDKHTGLKMKSSCR
jgi:hypothetical protein